MNNHSHVGIFWDFENCHPPKDTGYDIVNNIRQIAHRYGTITLFKAYLELEHTNSSSDSIALRSALQTSGVSLTDCPHNGAKDVADNMMIVDMLAYAIDTAAPATIVIISGDRDFAYAASILRLRKYEVILLMPDTTHESLFYQATAIIDWKSEVVDKLPGDASLKPKSELIRRKQKAQSHSRASSTVEKSTSKDDNHNDPVVLSTNYSSSHKARASLSIPRLQQRRGSTLAEALPVGVPTPFTGVDSANLIPEPAIDDAVFYDSDDVSDSARPTTQTVDCSTDANSPAINAMPIVGDIPKTNAESVSRDAESAQLPNTFFNLPELIIRPATASGLLAVNVQDIAALPPPAALPIPFPEVGLDHAVPDPAPPVVLPSAPAPAPAPFLVPDSNTLIQKNVPLSGGVRLSKPCPSPLPTSPIVHTPLAASQPSHKILIPAHFAPLIIVLEDLRSKDINRPSRSQVASTLIQHNAWVFKAAGVTRWKEYANLAVVQKLITLGATEGDVWVSLATNWTG